MHDRGTFGNRHEIRTRCSGSVRTSPVREKCKKRHVFLLKRSEISCFLFRSRKAKSTTKFIEGSAAAWTLMKRRIQPSKTLPADLIGNLFGRTFVLTSCKQKWHYWKLRLFLLRKGPIRDPNFVQPSARYCVQDRDHNPVDYKELHKMMQNYEKDKSGKAGAGTKRFTHICSDPIRFLL